MEISNNTVTNSQKETCAVITMRDTAALLAQEKNISYKDALILFAGSNIYDALFDFDTGIWKESPVYLLDLYNRYANLQKER